MHINNELYLVGISSFAQKVCSRHSGLGNPKGQTTNIIVDIHSTHSTQSMYTFSRVYA